MCTIRRLFHRAALTVAYALISVMARVDSLPALRRMKLRIGIALLALGSLSACAGAKPETESPEGRSDTDAASSADEALDTELLEEVVCYDPVEEE